MDLRFGRSHLLRLLDNAGLTQREFARRLKVSEPYISSIVKGKEKLSLIRAKRAADILNCSIEELYEWIYE